MPAIRAAVALAALVLASSALGAQHSAATTAAGGATLAGVVYDSLHGRPLAGAMVQLVPAGAHPGPTHAVEADSLGTFRFDGLRADRYVIGFRHPVVDALGLSEPAWRVQVSGDSVHYVMLALPSALGMRSRFCASPSESDSSGMLIGIVRDPDSGVPLAGASVTVLWNELIMDARGLRHEEQRFPGKSNAEGRYMFCSLPAAVTLTARAEVGKRASGYVELWIPPRGLLHRDFAIPSDSASIVVTTNAAGAPEAEPVRRGTARLSGRALNANGQPMAGAQVAVLGSAGSSTTAADGAFTLAALPAGTHMLEARAVGYEPRRVVVDLVSGQTATVTVQFTARIQELERVVVYGQKQSSRLLDLMGFEERRKRGMGRYFAAEDIDKRKPTQFSDLLRGLPGMRVDRRGAFNTRIWMQGPGGLCAPVIYVDRALLASSDEIDVMVNPDEISGVEIYSSAASTPGEFVRPGRPGDHPCGTILIWLGTGRRNANR
jgi:hypothetical protein